jgi:hypothetical protein
MSLKRSLLVVLTLLAGFSLSAAADSAEPLGYLDELPPLLDRELFFGDPEISAAQLSPDGSTSPSSAPTRACAISGSRASTNRSTRPSPLTADDKPVPGYFWTQDGPTCSMSRTRAAMRTSTSGRLIQTANARTTAACRGTQPDRHRWRSRHDHRPAQRHAGPHAGRPQRPRPGAARRLCRDHFDRRTRTADREQPEHCRLERRPGRQRASWLAPGQRGRHRGPARRRRRTR